MLQLCFVHGCPLFASAEEHGVSASSTRVFSVFGFPITDSVIASWIVALFIILILRIALRGGVRTIPSRGQAVIESLVEGLESVIKPIVGQKSFKVVFPLLFGYFSYILIQNWSGIFPGIGSIGINVDGEFRPLLRPANSDLNTTLALAILSFFAWFYYSIKCAGIKGLYGEIFGNKVKKSEVSSSVYRMLFVIFFAVGFIECVSILCRIISLSFRLFGNIFGGENLLHNMYGFSEKLANVPVANFLSYLIPLPFYFFEFLVTIIQAFVFTLLVSIYIGSVTSHSDSEHDVDCEFLEKEQI